MTEKQHRLPRFKRDPDAAQSFQITHRDLEILRHVAEHRFIRSEWIIKLVGGSKQQIIRRLNLLYHHGYLDRPRCQLDYYHQEGSKSLVYGLASRGAGRLRRDLNMPFERMDWTTRNKGVRRLFLDHTLTVSAFMAALEIGCRNRHDIRLLYAHELLNLKDTSKNVKNFSWSVNLSGKRRIAVVPDKVFALEVTYPDKRIECTHYFLEADQGTMPIERRDFRQSCVFKKLKAYEATQTTGIYRMKLGMRRFIALIITHQRERMESISQAICNIRPHRACFLVSLFCEQQTGPSIAMVFNALRSSNQTCSAADYHIHE